MSEANQYLLGDVDTIAEHIDRRSVYAPALLVLANEQVPPSAKDYVDRILDGEGIFWDLPPLSNESWEVYAGIEGFYAQLLRLLCRDVTIDVWPAWQRSQWIAGDWYPLGREFGWKIACRPLKGVVFRDRHPAMPDATRYLSSWPHGWLRLRECRSYAPYLRDRICELAIDLGLQWDLDNIKDRLSEPELLDDDERFEIHNLVAGRTDQKAWQFERSFVLYGAMRRAIDRDKDLISVGY